MNAELDTLLTDPSFFANPYPAYARLREEAPVCWSEAWGGWVLTRYADVVAAFQDVRRFSSAGRIAYLLESLPPEERSRFDDVQAHYRAGVAHVDPPDHTRLRALLTPFFTPRRLAALVPRIEQVTARLLAGLEGQPTADLIAGLAYPLPAAVVLELIGAPEADRDLFRNWALGVNALFAAGGRTAAAAVAQAQASLAEMRAYIAELAAARRRAPREDVVSVLAARCAAGDLTEAELVSTCVTLFVAGHETTTNLIGNGMVALLRRPAVLQELRRGLTTPELLKSAVEELLRFDTPVQRGWRIAAEDVEVGGRLVRRGQLVLPMLGAANRDPAHFPDPDRLDLARRENRHLGFGYGIHFCLGAPLARLEVPAALAGLLARFPRITLDESRPLPWRRDVALRGVEALPVLLEGR